jgi:L-lactate dehydrogenase complex protein LldG
MNSSREEFFSRVRQAVRTGNRPGCDHHLEPVDFARIKTPNHLVLQFQTQFNAVGGIFHLVADAEACIEELRMLVTGKFVKHILLGSGKLNGKWGLASRLRSAEVDVILINDLEVGSCREPFFAADMGISTVDYLVAETGSVVLHSGITQPRSLSLLPPIHVAIAERDQIVADLFDLFPSSSNRLEQALPSCVTFITGPSKTGDIELKLVTGVHGPREIHVILMES